VNGYYETVFADMVTEDCLSFSPVFFNADRWYEIDTIDDLIAADQVCSSYEHPMERLPDHDLNDQKGTDFFQAAIRLPAIALSKRAPRLSHDKDASVSIIPALPSIVPQPI